MNKCSICDFEIPEDIYEEHIKNCRNGELHCHFCNISFKSNLESRLAHLRKCQTKHPIMISRGTNTEPVTVVNIATSTEDVATVDLTTEDLPESLDLPSSEAANGNTTQDNVIVIEDDADIVSITPLFQQQETDVFDLNNITVEPMDSQTGSEPLASVEELYNMYLAYIDGIF